MKISLNTTIDVAALGAAFARDGAVQVPDVLTDASARRVYRCLADATPWSRVFNQDGKHFDVAEEQVRALPAPDRARMESAIAAQAREHFQYYYCNYPIHDAVRAGLNEGHLLHEFHALINSDEFLDRARALTGCDDIRFADAQATCFLPGHFLTEHDDHAEGKNRRAAYVFSFTPTWRPDWGGYLQLFDEHGDVRRGLRPTYNALNLLAVPQPHSVGQVASFAGAPRLSITGWLRAGDVQEGGKMNDAPTHNVQAGAANWDAYWRGAGAVAGELFDPALGRALAAFWTGVFDSRFANDVTPDIIDLACGDGEVLHHALAVAAARDGRFVGVDYSAAAVDRLAQRDQRLTGVAASAQRVPFEDGAFAIVTSQFGIEYAGRPAFTEAARLVAPGGTLALAMHLGGGAVHSECQSNLAATDEVLATRLLPLTGSVFRIGYEVLHGRKEPAALRKAEALLRPATGQAKDIVRRFGQGVAGGKIVALLQSLGQIYSRLQAYEPAEALHWVETADTELRAYAGRLRAMLDAAVDEAALAQIVAQLQESGLSIERNDTLAVGPKGEPAARILVAVRE